MQTNFIEVGALDLLFSGTVTSQTYTYIYTQADSDGDAHFVAAIKPAYSLPLWRVERAGVGSSFQVCYLLGCETGAVGLRPDIPAGRPEEV